MTRLAEIMLLALLTSSLALQAWLGARQVAHLRRLLQSSSGAFRTNQTVAVARHAAARAILRVVAFATQAVLIGMLTLGGGLAWLQRLSPSRSPFDAAVVVEVVLLLLLVRVAAEACQRFAVDGRLGLNRMDASSFLVDAARRTAGAVALAAVAGVAVSSLIEADRDHWWVEAALLLSLGLIVKAWLSPVLGAWRARAMPLHDGALATRLAGLLARCGFRRVAVVMTNESCRSARANARALGMAGACRIELSDTLVSLLSADEIAAVVAHEAGHLRLHHRSKDVAGRILLGAAAMAACSALEGNAAMAGALRLSQGTGAVAMAALVLMTPVAGLLLTPLASCWYRRLEYEADAFAARHVAPQHLAAALRKLNGANATMLSSDPLYAAFHGRHPEPHARLRRLLADDDQACPTENS